MTTKRNAMGAGVPAGAANTLIGGVTDNFIATGTTQATAALLTFGSNTVVRTGASNTGVILAPGNGSGDGFFAGDWTRVSNFVAGNAINVYPPVGGKIQNGTTNAAFSVGALKTAEFTCIDGLNFFVNLSA